MKTDPRELFVFQCIVGNIDSSWICFLRRPEDDLIKVETCRTDSTLFLLYIKQSVVLLTGTFVLTSGWKTLKKLVRHAIKAETCSRK